MKIGIITPYDSANYGAYLQAYANCVFLKKQGHEVVFIKWRTRKERKKEFFKKPQSLRAVFSLIRKYPHNKERYEKMTQALPLLPEIDFETAKRLSLDAICVGSDEIWNINTPLFQNPVFYGIPDICEKTYAYAPSAANATIEDFIREKHYAARMQKVNIIGVRDENTAAIAQVVCGEKPKLVCDPTLLITREDYEVSITPAFRGDYLLVYSYNVKPEYQQYLRRYADEKGLLLVSACMYQKWCDVNINCMPLEFINVVEHAAAVFTTTFHGSIFTLLCEKNCAIEGESKKVADLLHWTGASTNQVTRDLSYESFKLCLETTPDYSAIREKIAKRREASAKIYKEGLALEKGFEV